MAEHHNVRVGSSEETLIGQTFHAVQDALLFQEPMPLLFTVGQADEACKKGSCGLCESTCILKDKVRDMMLGFVEGSSDVSGLGGSQVCKESMQNSITSIFLLLDYVPIFYEPAVIVQVQMSYD